MSRLLSEKQVLEKLDIPDFRYMTKDKVIALASMYDRLDPKVAMKAIEQFPDFTSVMRESIKDLTGTVEEGIKSGEKGTAECLLACRQMLNTLDKVLDDDQLTFEEKERIIDTMKDVLNMMDKVQKDQKHFIHVNIGMLASTVVGVGLIALGMLGGQANIHLPDSIGDGFNEL